MDAALRLCLRHALHAVSAALETKRTVCAVALDGEENLLVAVKRSLVRAHHVDTPSARLAIAGIHSEEVSCEKRGLVAARPRAHLEHCIATLKRIRRQKSCKHGAFRLRHLRLQTFNLALRLFCEVWILQKRFVALYVVKDFEITRGGSFQLAQGRMFAHDGAIALRVRNDRRITHGGLHFAEAPQDIGYL